MKILSSFKFLSLFFLLSFIYPTDTEEYCAPAEEEDFTLSSMIKICDFASSIAPGVGCSNSVLELTVNEDCVGEGIARIRAVNLSPNPQSGVPYTLPLGMPELHYEYTVLGQAPVTLDAANAFYYIGDTPLPGGGSTPLYEYLVKMNVDVSDYCGEDGYVHVPMTVRLVEPSGQLYQVDNYAGSMQPFYCSVFAETCDICTNAPIGCPGNAEPIYIIEGCGSCVGQEEACRGRSSFLEEEFEINDLEIQPNPFKEILTVRFSAKGVNDYFITLIDSKGSTVYTNSEASIEGVNTMKMKTDNFSKGIYFCRISIDGKVMTKKIIKQ